MTDSTPSANQTTNETPLQGWKEIAAYLERDVRTAQRWEEGVGLPVRRHGGASGSVYAYPAEIEQWRASQPTKSAAQAPKEGLSLRRLVPALAMGVAGVAALGIIRFGPILNPPSPRAEAAEDGVRTEVVWDQAAGISTQGSISPDGKYLTYVDWIDEGNLAVRNLETGENRRLTDDADGNTLFLGKFSYAGESRISPDGKQAAYSWATRVDLKAVETGEIRVLPLDGESQEPRVVWHPAEGSWAAVHDWFPDGDRLAVVVSASPNEHRIVTVSVSSGEVRQIRSLPWSDRPQVRVSPSGRYIAYSRSESQEEPARDIYIVTADGSAETAIVRHAARDELVDWGQDDQALLINSDRDGQPGLWAIPLQDGKLAGPLELIMSNVDVGGGVGFSDDGSLYYPVRVSRRRLKLAELDLETGKLLSKPRDAVERFLGRNHNGVFSPDGESFAYLSEREGWNQNAIVVRSLSTGKEYDLAHELKSVYSFLWSPVNDRLLVQGGDERGRYGYFDVGLSDGRARLIAENSWAGVLTPDGERLLHHTNQVEEGELRSYRFSDDSLETLRGGFDTGRFGVSPGGEIATVHDGIEIRVHPAEGGDPTILWQVDKERPLGRWVVWTTDGNYLVVLRRDPEAGEEMWRLWAVSVDGSPPRPSELVHELGNAGAWPIRFHPDGKTILYTEGGYFWQVWALRNLPATSGALRSE